ncbi:MAG: NAD-dependent deacylase [Flavobacteriia bacterium]|jgi:NAD-dependent deacetylase|nr:NAD-dependent deacylase [Flavobacteriia bacterium]NBP28754.1 NAD-dependent deacylase [Flavobacteriia bacterium]
MKKKLVVFSGAGMSAESGVQTFRGAEGLWENYRIEEVATPEAWNADPELVTRFYNQRRKHILECSPNEGHRIIASLEEQYEVRVITQNIDDLHERAGSSTVMHLHGNIRWAKSSGPNQEAAYYPVDGWELTQNDTCPEGYRLRPHVVWFGEEVPLYAKALEEIQTAEILIVVGTSLMVYPAAGLIHYLSPGCDAYVIDPNAHELHVPKRFTCLADTAVEGLKSVKEKLTF